MTIIKHKRGSGVPAATELEVGELAIDTLAAKLYTKIGNAVVELGGGSSDGSGAGMVISETEPADPETGLQWLEATTGRVWIWDEGKWLEFPASCASDDSGGGGSGGGGAWEVIEKFSASNVSSFEVDVPTDQYKKTRVVWHWKSSPDNNNRSIALRAKRGGVYLSTKDQYKTHITYTDPASSAWKYWDQNDRNGEVPLTAVAVQSGSTVVELDYSASGDGEANLFIDSWGRKSAHPIKQIISAQIRDGSGRVEALNFYANGNIDGTIYVEGLSD